MNFKAGQKIKMKEDCLQNGCKALKGVRFVLKADLSGVLHAVASNGDSVCWHMHKWELIPKTLDDIEEGDLLKDEDGDFARVLGRAGLVVFLSWSCSPGEEEQTDVNVNPLSIQELKDDGYTIVQDEEEPKELEVTIDEIAKWKGVDPKSIRVKKEE